MTPEYAHLIKLLEFYQLLGFNRLPFSLSRIDELSRFIELSPAIKVSQNNLEEQTIEKQTPSVVTESLQKEAEPLTVLSVDEALSRLREKIGDCTRCKLHKGRHTIVFGEGSDKLRLMFIGEAPGRDEDLQGRPFVGQAGGLLTKLIIKMGIKREDVYIANVVKCRPPQNRAPEPDEVALCKPFLLEQIHIIKPAVIMTLGAVATRNLLEKDASITALRGSVFTFKGAHVVPTFHPAYLLRNRDAKWDTWNDAQKALKLLSQS